MLQKIKINFKLLCYQGGHTSEMFKLLKELKLSKYSPRHYIIAETDKMSVDKTVEFESDLNEYKIHLIKRSRYVGQSYITSIFTTLVAILLSISLIYKIKPKVLLVNGPGTCIPLCMVSFILGVSSGKKIFLIYLISIINIAEVIYST